LRLLNFIETRTGELLTVDGIGVKRRKRISEHGGGEAGREIILFLQGHGVNTSKAVRIFKVYGDEAIEKYEAIRTCWQRTSTGIDFATADLVAQGRA
jgi:exodeoxyribonuclease V alpha subunit